MTNPYQTPGVQAKSGDQSLVGPPAIALMIVSGIAIGLGALGLIADIAFIMTGMVERMEAINEGPISERTTITIRAIWGLLLLIASTYVFYGAVKMKNLTDYRTAKAASIVAMVPLLGPCCLLGIPFGIWAFLTLNKPSVKSLFPS